MGLRWQIFLLWLIAGLASGTDYSDITNIDLTCTKSRYMKSYDRSRTLNYALSGHVYSTLNSKTLLSCATFCSFDGNCESFNFHKESKTCELNSGKASTSDDLVYKLGYQYRENEVNAEKNSLGACRDFPCYHGSTCSETCDSKGYECTCASSTMDPEQHCYYECNDPGLPPTDSDGTKLAYRSWSYPLKHGTVVDPAFTCYNAWYSATGSNSITCNDGSWSTLSSNPCIFTSSANSCGQSTIGVRNDYYWIGNSWLVSNSNHDGSYWRDWHGRLHRTSTPGNCWLTSGSGSQGHYLQVYFGAWKLVKEIQTQGRYDWYEWTNNYWLYYHGVDSTWHYANAGGVFTGNWDHNSIRYNYPNKFVANYIQFRPYSWNGRIAMRVDVLAC